MKLNMINISVNDHWSPMTPFIWAKAKIFANTWAPLWSTGAAVPLFWHAR